MACAKTRLSALLLACAALLPGFGTAAEQDLRESFDLQVPVAPTPVVVEGRARLFYELHLTNFAAEPLRPLALEVFAAGSGLPVARFDVDALAARTALVGPADEAQLQGAIPPGRRAALYLELELSPEAVPPAFDHHLAYAGDDGARHTIPGPRVAMEAAKAPVLGPPLRGGPWTAVFDPGWARGHRRVFYAVEGRATIPGRFAIDWVKLDEDGRMARGDADLAGNAHAYGEQVLAVADATVVAVRNDYPETARLSENGRHGLAGASGNHVVLDLENGRHAFYEHLRPGSVRVAVGQRVRRGQPIAEVGYSGSGNWPHLHFHLGDAPSLLGAEGLPFVIDGFRALGRYPDFDDLGKRPWTPRARGDDARRRHERPVDNGVVMFPE